MKRPLFIIHERISKALRLTTRTGSLAVPAFVICLTAHPTVSRFIIGVCLALIGSAIRLWAAGTLVKRQVLTVAGPYRYIRNPLYFGGGIIAIGLLIINGSWIAFIIATIITLIFYPRQIRRETAFLLQSFGKSYEEYAAHVGAYFPRLTPYTPDQTEGSSITFSFKRMKRNHELDGLLALLVCLGILSIPLWTGDIVRYQRLIVILFVSFWGIRLLLDEIRRIRTEKLPGEHWVNGEYHFSVAPAWSSKLTKSTLESFPNLVSDSTNEVLYNSRNTIVRIPAEKFGVEHPLIIKRFASPQLLPRLRDIAKSSKAARSFKNALLLEQHGFRTPSPVVYIVRRRWLVMRESYFVTQDIPEMIEIRNVLSRPDSQYASLLTEKFVKQIAVFMRKLHDAGFRHRDLSDGNLLFQIEHPDAFILIDLNRMRFYPCVGLLEGVQDLIRIGIPVKFQEIFLNAYTEGLPHKDILFRYYRFRKWWFTSFISFKKRSGLRSITRRLGI